MIDVNRESPGSKRLIIAALIFALTTESAGEGL